MKYIKVLWLLLSQMRGMDWGELLGALKRGSWRTRVVGVCAVLLFAVCASLSALGVEVPEAVWAFVPTVAVGAIGVVARDEKVTSEAAGAQANSPPTASPAATATVTGGAKAAVWDGAGRNPRSR